MNVWRILHDCRAWHGPLGQCPDMDWVEADAPSYGARLEAPQGDPTISHIRIEPWYVFGTLTEQFPRWWMTGEAPEKLPRLWWAVLFEVDPNYAFVGKNQVMFDSYHATVIDRTKSDFPRDEWEWQAASPYRDW